jgi:dihydroneopterin aldolase
MHSNLQLHNIALSVSLGWAETERSKKQSIMLDVTLYFPKPPKACITDHLDDTCDYDNLIQLIIEKTETQSFRLIEHLAAYIYQVINTAFPIHNGISISVMKKPSIERLIGGVAFQLNIFNADK